MVSTCKWRLVDNGDGTYSTELQNAAGEWQEVDTYCDLAAAGAGFDELIRALRWTPDRPKRVIKEAVV